MIIVGLALFTIFGRPPRATEHAGLQDSLFVIILIAIVSGVFC